MDWSHYMKYDTTGMPPQLKKWLWTTRAAKKNKASSIFYHKTQILVEEAGFDDMFDHIKDMIEYVNETTLVQHISKLGITTEPEYRKMSSKILRSLGMPCASRLHIIYGKSWSELIHSRKRGNYVSKTEWKRIVIDDMGINTPKEYRYLVYRI